MVDDRAAERVGVHSRTAMAGQPGGGSRIGCLREVGHHPIVPSAGAHRVSSRQSFLASPHEEFATDLAEKVAGGVSADKPEDLVLHSQTFLPLMLAEEPAQLGDEPLRSLFGDEVPGRCDGAGDGGGMRAQRGDGVGGPVRSGRRPRDRRASSPAARSLRFSAPSVSRVRVVGEPAAQPVTPAVCRGVHDRAEASGPGEPGQHRVDRDRGAAGGCCAPASGRDGAGEPAAVAAVERSGRSVASLRKPAGTPDHHDDAA